LLSVTNLQSPEVAFVQALISTAYDDRLEQIGAHHLSDDEKDQMYTTDGAFASDVALAKSILPT
jgi:hypothetical protein